MRTLIASGMLFLQLGCATLGLRPHGMSGSLDKTPEVLILRGEDYSVCALPGRTIQLHYFIVLRWMDPQVIAVWAGKDTETAGHVHVGPTNRYSVRMNASVPPGMLAYHQVNVEVKGRVYSSTTVVMDCGLPATWGQPTQ